MYPESINKNILSHKTLYYCVHSARNQFTYRMSTSTLPCAIVQKIIISITPVSNKDEGFFFNFLKRQLRIGDIIISSINDMNLIYRGICSGLRVRNILSVSIIFFLEIKLKIIIIITQYTWRF